jgi:hypothetical protein
MILKQSYVTYVKNHKNSKGETSPWVIKKHETGEILASFSTKEKAQQQLKNMHIHSKGSTTMNLIKEAVSLRPEIENMYYEYLASILDAEKEFNSKYQGEEKELSSYISNYLRETLENLIQGKDELLDFKKPSISTSTEESSPETYDDEKKHKEVEKMMEWWSKNPALKEKRSSFFFRNINSIEDLLKKAQEEEEVQTKTGPGGETLYLQPNGNWSTTPPSSTSDTTNSKGVGSGTTDYSTSSPQTARQFAQQTKNVPKDTSGLVYNYPGR